MKNLLFAIALLICLAGCKKEEFSYQSDFEKSYDTWLNYKAGINNSYSYTVTTGSVFGFGTQTKLTITQGKITGREYQAYRIAQVAGGTPTIVAAWTETAASLNTHASQGADLLTLDEVYDKARTVWLKADKKANDISFSAGNNGLISSCGYFPKECQDDCFHGITISAIQTL